MLCYSEANPDQLKLARNSLSQPGFVLCGIDSNVDFINRNCLVAAGEVSYHRNFQFYSLD